MAVSFDTILKLDMLSPSTMDSLGIVSATRYSKSNKNFRNPTHAKCPFCGSLEMTPKAVQGQITQWFCSCHGNKYMSNFDLFRKVNTIDDRDEAAQRFCEIAGIEFKTDDDKSNAPKQLSPEEIQQFVTAEIENVKGTLKDFPADQLRGFEPEDLEPFDIGVEKFWTHIKMPNSPTTTRFIVPLGDKGNYSSYNAILTHSERERLAPLRKQEKPPKWTDKCLTTGSKLVFNPDALKEKIVPTTEGEFDALAIMKAFNFRQQACALGGAGQHSDICKRLAAMDEKPYILLIGDDDAGNDAIQRVLKKILETHTPAVTRHLEQYMSADDISKVQGKVDANAVMIKLGTDYLRNLVTKIIIDVDDELNALAEKFADSELPLDDREPDIPSMHMRKKTAKNRTNYRPEIQELLDRINAQITPDMLEQQGILVHSANGNSRPDGYCCPWCGSGTGKHQTGALKFITDDGEPHFGCGKCTQGGNVFGLIAKVRRLDISGKNFFVHLRAVADEFGVKYDPTIFDQSHDKRLILKGVAREKIDSWLAINGGAIAPEVVNALFDAEKFFDDITPEKITPELVRSSVTAQNLALATFYDFMSAAVDKFFDAFETAKANAAEQIVNAKAGLTAKPSQKTLAVARLNRREISNNIGRKLTEIRKAHKRFIADFESKKLRDDYQAREQKQLEASKAALGDGYKLSPEQAAFLLAQDDDDYGRATQFAFLNGKKIRYISSREQWAVFEKSRDFDGCGIWKLGNPTRNTIVMPFAADVHKFLVANAPQTPEASFESNVKNWRNFKCMNNAIKLAGASNLNDIQITPQDLDAHPNLIMCKNGVVDLRTKKFYENVAPSLYITKMCNVIFNPKADPEEVLKFLQDILPDESTLAAVLCWLGYNLTGEVSQQKIHFWKGEGANGKSTLLATFLYLLGTYGVKIPSELITESFHPPDANSATPALASLMGVRAAISSELRENARLNAQITKDLTSGEILPVRLLHCNSETFKPICKLTICGNFFPRIGNVNDKGIRRRLQTVEFNQTFEGRDADPELPEKLLERNNLSALFNILVDNAFKFYRTGKLIESEDMRQTYNAYIDENDIVANFVDEYCVRGRDKIVLRKDIFQKFYDTYRADAVRLRNNFESILTKRYGITRNKTNKGIEFRGIGLLDEPPAGAPVKKSNDTKNTSNNEDFPEDMAPPDM